MPKKKAEASPNYARVEDISNLYTVMKEIQANIEYINDRLEKCMSKLGVEK